MVKIQLATFRAGQFFEGLFLHFLRPVDFLQLTSLPLSLEDFLEDLK